MGLVSSYIDIRAQCLDEIPRIVSPGARIQSAFICNIHALENHFSVCQKVPDELNREIRSRLVGPVQCHIEKVGGEAIISPTALG